MSLGASNPEDLQRQVLTNAFPPLWPLVVIRTAAFLGVPAVGVLAGVDAQPH
jgi:hypothetical protein